MKALDVAKLLTVVEVTIKDIDDKNGEIKEVQRSVRNFYSLDEELKGQAGSAIRGFYQDMYEPFLIFLKQSLKDYKQALTEIREKVIAFESNEETGYISQAFLENDVTEGFNQVGEEA